MKNIFWALFTDEMRDDLPKLNIPSAAKRYNRNTGLKWAGPAGPRLYKRAMNQIANPGKSLKFKSYDVVGPVKSAIKEASARIIQKLLN